MTDAAVTAEVEAQTTDVQGHLVVQRGAAAARRQRYESLTGQQKVAVVLAQLRQETSAAILKALGDEEAVTLANEIANLPPLDRDVVARVVEEFIGKVNTTRSINQGGFAFARRVLGGCNRRGARRQGHADDGQQRHGGAPCVPLPGGPFKRRPAACGRASSDGRGDPRPHPAGRRLPFARRHAERLSRRGRRAHRDDGCRVAGGDRHRGTAARESTQDPRCHRGLRAGRCPPLVELLNGADGSTEKQVFASLEERDPELAEAVRARMFTFEDVLAMEDRTLQLVLRGIKIPDLAIAIKGASDDPEVMDKIKRNLSDRGQSELTEEIEVMGPVRMSMVDAAQSSIVRAVRELEASGEIVIARQTDELL